jgi:hypothetical protein
MRSMVEGEHRKLRVRRRSPSTTLRGSLSPYG